MSDEERDALLVEMYRRMDRALALRRKHLHAINDAGLRLINHCAISAAKDIEELNRDYSNRY